jgi:hypothetical protein
MLRSLLPPVLLMAICLSLLGCAATPPMGEPEDFRTRAETRAEGGVRVSAAVLSPAETEDIFSLPLARKKIQPVWIEIDNQEDKDFAVMLLSIDPDYFAPSEVAWKFRAQHEMGPDEMMDMFLERALPAVVPRGTGASGFVYTNLDPGAKAFAVELVAEGEVRSFEFAQVVPGFEADFMTVDFEQLYPAGLRDLDLKGLREYLEGLPCCVAGGDGKTPGDPLNLVIVGDGRHVLATLVRRGWDLTETMRRDTVWLTVASSLFGRYYRTSPVSPLYLFDRPQDFALQKARRTVDERNHLRLWLAPVTLDGESVWVGQISRDIGVKASSKTLVTHKIDPVVDEARFYITLDLAASETLRAYGAVKGVGYSDRAAPRFNYTKDPYYTDGLRAVLILGKGRQHLENLKRLPWEQPIHPEQRPERVSHPAADGDGSVAQPENG